MKKIQAYYETIPMARDESFAWREFRQRRFSSPWHFHPHIELTLIVHGRGVRYMGDSIEPFQDGDFVLVGSNLPHYWSNMESAKRVAHSIVIQFAPDFLGASFLSVPE